MEKNKEERQQEKIYFLQKKEALSVRLCSTSTAAGPGSYIFFSIIYLVLKKKLRASLFLSVTDTHTHTYKVRTDQLRELYY